MIASDILTHSSTFSTCVGVVDENVNRFAERALLNLQVGYRLISLNVSGCALTDESIREIVQVRLCSVIIVFMLCCRLLGGQSLVDKVGRDWQRVFC